MKNIQGSSLVWKKTTSLIFYLLLAIPLLFFSLQLVVENVLFAWSLQFLFSQLLDNLRHSAFHSYHCTETAIDKDINGLIRSLDLFQFLFSLFPLVSVDTSFLSLLPSFVSWPSYSPLSHELFYNSQTVWAQSFCFLFCLYFPEVLWCSVLFPWLISQPDLTIQPYISYK